MSRLSLKIAAALVVATPLAALAGGPMSSCLDTHGPIKYSGAGTISLRYDAGTPTNALGTRTKAQADTIVNNAIALWNNVPTATVTLARGTDLPVDVNVTNYSTYYGNYGDGINPVVYDTNGSIIDADIGVGASDSILGFAGSAWGGSTGVNCRYFEGQAVINGKIAISDAVMTNVIAHEVGHLIGMDHTQLDSTQGLAGSNYPLMYPIAYRSLYSLHEDDVAAVSAIYPEATISATYGEVTGTFVTAAGTPLSGGNIVAQGTAGTTGVFSSVSDYRQEGNGYFRFLLPPGTYTLRAEAIDPSFDGGSSVGPHSEDWTRPSFQPPFYSVGGTFAAQPTGPMATVTLGGGTPTNITVTAGCAGTVLFRINGTGTVGGNCVPAAPPPGAPTQVTPTGTVTTTTPTYTWNAISGATSYNLLVQNTGGVVVNVSSTATAAGCAAGTGTCSVTPATALTNGSAYNWFVNAVNTGGTSPWSSGLSITVSTGPVATPPAPPVTATPTGTITTTTPTYTWAASAGATSYYLLVQNTGGVVIGQTYAASALGCVGGGTCTITPSTALVNTNTYNWYVSASNTAGTSTWSIVKTITVSTGAPTPTMPAAVTTVSPTGTIAVTTPSYTWNAISGATSYDLLVQNTAGVAVNATFTATAAGCAAGTGSCTVTPSNALTNGAAYNWFVRATNSVGTGGWSAARGINISIATPAPAVPVTVTPSGAITTTTPVYTWNAVSGATSYTLQVTGTAGMVINTSYTSAQAACATTCSVTPATALTNGQAYNWSVNATGTGGSSAFSAARPFNVSVPVGPTIPGTPTLVSPSGSIATLTPTYTWNAMAGVTSYELLVQNTAGVAVYVTYPASSVGCGAGTGTCAALPSTALTNGAVYNWFVRGTNSLGTGPWSGANTISVSGAGPSIPGAPVTIAPTGTVNSTTPTFSWNAISGATSYYLLVQNTAGVAVSTSVSPAAAGCGAGTGTCSIVPSTALSNGAVYNWFVNATNSLGTGPWSGATTITISATGPSVPLAPVTISPGGTLATRTPTYTWNASAGATSYYFLVQNTAGVLIGTSITASSVGCGAGTGTCTYTPGTSLAAGATYNWFVNATNSLGTSPWSGARTITAP